ncbi:peptide/nickel transport system permease protein [Orenia metallireducens]|uniref:Peptide/nickel transport system permease protein n=1 Tax=Orenia metallireducens TaxID=1413210 RepID=A0A285G1K6_9FIRM|nr:ABC transporter permease [Orenia metallireducens]PRX31791.1 peptide/nickel transport system permease protein [Orenia metallireducens]SNY17298.1 peptide/nickel transport system permease protein [Orenia metallireducens]
MLNYILRRLLILIPILIFISLFIFVIIKLTPGDPALVLLGERATEQALNQTRIKYGLDQPLHIQYFKMMENFFKGDLKSINYKQNVISVIINRLPATLELGAAALVIAIIVSIPAGIISAIKRNSVFDYISMSIALLGISIPVFYTGIILMYIFAVKLNWLPASGYGGHIWTTEGFKYFILPAISLSFVLMASTTRLTRSSILEVIQEDYIRTARAKGVKEKSVILIHAFKNALVPIVTNIGNQVAGIFAGAVLTETVFAWPGVGRLAVNAIFRRDEPLVFGCVIFLSAVYVIVNLIVDLVYTLINPQITYD